MTGLRIRVLTGVVLGFALFAVGSYLTADFRPEDAALGPFTISRGAVFNKHTVSHQNADGLRESLELVKRIKQQEERVALWLGASHQYAINGYHPGEENAVYHANRLARARGAALTYLGHGLPNGNFYEFLTLYLYFRESGYIPDHLVIGALYDDLREPGIRPKVRALIDTIGASLLADLGEVGHQLREAQQSAPPPIERNVMDGTPQQILEASAVKWIEASWQPFEYRHRFSAWIGWRWRHSVFDVGEWMRQLGYPAPKVPAVPLSLQQWNEGAMWCLLDQAVVDGVDILVYKVPHPPTSGPFYHDRIRYDDFHSRLRARCDSLGVRYLDLEHLIDLPNWMFESNIDHWHFQETGHILLATAIDAAKIGND